MVLLKYFLGELFLKTSKLPKSMPIFFTACKEVRKHTFSVVGFAIDDFVLSHLIANAQVFNQYELLQIQYWH